MPALSEFVSAYELADVERFADHWFGKAGIDVAFTNHFKQRLNDERNGQPITAQELADLFKKEAQQWGRSIAGQGPDIHSVLKDMATDIHVPFVLDLDSSTGEYTLVAKTVMRAKDFRVTDTQPVYKVESVNESDTRGYNDGRLNPHQLQQLIMDDIDGKALNEWAAFPPGIHATVAETVYAETYKTLPELGQDIWDGKNFPGFAMTLMESGMFWNKAVFEYKKEGKLSHIDPRMRPLINKAVEMFPHADSEFEAFAMYMQKDDKEQHELEADVNELEQEIDVLRDRVDNLESKPAAPTESVTEEGEPMTRNEAISTLHDASEWLRTRRDRDGATGLSEEADDLLVVETWMRERFGENEAVKMVERSVADLNQRRDSDGAAGLDEVADELDEAASFLEKQMVNEDYMPELQGYVKLGDGVFADSGMIVARKDAPDKVAGEIKSVMRDDSKPGAWQMITLSDGSDENPLDYVLHSTNKVPGLVPEPGTVDDEGSLIGETRNPHHRDLEALRRSGAGGSHGDRKKQIPRKGKENDKKSIMKLIGEELHGMDENDSGTQDVVWDTEIQESPGYKTKKNPSFKTITYTPKHPRLGKRMSKKFTFYWHDFIVDDRDETLIYWNYGNSRDHPGDNTVDFNSVEDAKQAIEDQIYNYIENPELMPGKVNENDENQIMKLIGEEIDRLDEKRMLKDRNGTFWSVRNEPEGGISMAPEHPGLEPEDIRVFSRHRQVKLVAYGNETGFATVSQACNYVSGTLIPALQAKGKLPDGLDEEAKNELLNGLDEFIEEPSDIVWKWHADGQPVSDIRYATPFPSRNDSAVFYRLQPYKGERLLKDGSVYVRRVVDRDSGTILAVVFRDSEEPMNRFLEFNRQGWTEAEAEKAENEAKAYAEWKHASAFALSEGVEEAVDKAITEACGLVTAQNATIDVPIGGEYMNIKKMGLDASQLKCDEMGWLKKGVKEVLDKQYTVYKGTIPHGSVLDLMNEHIKAFHSRRAYPEKKKAPVTPLSESTKFDMLVSSIIKGDESSIIQALEADSHMVVHDADSSFDHLLHHAAHWGQADIAQLLLDAGADPNQTNLFDQTPLHVVQDKETAQVLLDAGGDINVVSEKGYGYTPLDMAELPDREQGLKEFLAKKGGKSVTDLNEGVAELTEKTLASDGQVKWIRDMLRQGKMPEQTAADIAAAIDGSSLTKDEASRIISKYKNVEGTNPDKASDKQKSWILKLIGSNRIRGVAAEELTKEIENDTLTKVGAGIAINIYQIIQNKFSPSRGATEEQIAKIREIAAATANRRPIWQIIAIWEIDEGLLHEDDAQRFIDANSKYLPGYRAPAVPDSGSGDNDETA